MAATAKHHYPQSAPSWDHPYPQPPHYHHYQYPPPVPGYHWPVTPPSSSPRYTAPVAPAEPIVPRENDILMGRGGKNNMFAGNDQLRKMATAMRDRYMVSSKKEKSAMSRELVEQVQALTPPGRFLKRENVSAAWFEVDLDSAREKASQCLRDAVTIVKKNDGNSNNNNNKTMRSNSRSNIKSTQEKRKERAVNPVTPPRSRASTPKLVWEAPSAEIEMPPLELSRGSKRPRIGTWEVDTAADIDATVMDFVHTIPVDSGVSMFAPNIAAPEEWALFDESFLATEAMDCSASENSNHVADEEDMDPFGTDFF